MGAEFVLVLGVLIWVKDATELTDSTSDFREALCERL